MILTVVQPAYFMNVDALAKVAAADLVVWADTFLFKKGSTINRTQIKTAEGGRWLTIPILKKGKGPQAINQCEIDNHEPWTTQHWKNIENNYKNSPYFFYFEPELQGMLGKQWGHLNSLLFASFEFLVRSLFPGKQIMMSSELPEIGERSQRILEWAGVTGSHSYLVEEKEIDLIDCGLLQNTGLSLYAFRNKIIPYHQQFRGFVAGLSGLDLLFNEGEMSAFIIKNGIHPIPVNEVLHD